VIQDTFVHIVWIEQYCRHVICYTKLIVNKNLKKQYIMWNQIKGQHKCNLDINIIFENINNQHINKYLNAIIFSRIRIYIAAKIKLNIHVFLSKVYALVFFLLKIYTLVILVLLVFKFVTYFQIPSSKVIFITCILECMTPWINLIFANKPLMKCRYWCIKLFSRICTM